MTASRLVNIARDKSSVGKRSVNDGRSPDIEAELLKKQAELPKKREKKKMSYPITTTFIL